MSNQFDKFVEDLEKRQQEHNEKKKSQNAAEKAWPARKLREKYQEKPGNRTTWGR